MNSRNYSDYGDALTVDEAKTLLHVSHKTVYTMIKTNRLQAVRVGRTYIVPKSAIIAMIEGKPRCEFTKPQPLKCNDKMLFRLQNITDKGENYNERSDY